MTSIDVTVTSDKAIEPITIVITSNSAASLDCTGCTITDTGTVRILTFTGARWGSADGTPGSHTVSVTTTAAAGTPIDIQVEVITTVDGLVAAVGGITTAVPTPDTTTTTSTTAPPSGFGVPGTDAELSWSISANELTATVTIGDQTYGGTAQTDLDMVASSLAIADWNGDGLPELLIGTVANWHHLYTVTETGLIKISAFPASAATNPNPWADKMCAEPAPDNIVLLEQSDTEGRVLEVSGSELVAGATTSRPDPAAIPVAVLDGNESPFVACSSLMAPSSNPLAFTFESPAPIGAISVAYP